MSGKAVSFGKSICPGGDGDISPVICLGCLGETLFYIACVGMGFARDVGCISVVVYWDRLFAFSFAYGCG